ncbi:MAG: sodium-dependent transporter [Vulcanimicrobiota bacterium]
MEEKEEKILEQPEQGKRDQWASKLGLVLAMAGNAVGLGNFIRFPMQAAKHGGSIFMIPYAISFLLLGLPLMFMEWGMGRFGGSKGHATMTGIFALIKNNKLFRWLGAIGIWIPLVIASYYCFIESWTIGYSIHSILANVGANQTPAQAEQFFNSYISIKSYVPYVIFLFTVGVNGYILYRGISKGIEKVAKVLMPLLFVFAIVLVIRVFTLGTPDPAHPDRSILEGFGFMWNLTDLRKLADFNVWVAAAGQIFFTLSLGMGAIACYASYVDRSDDVVVSGLATALTNEGCEVILGSSIAIPMAVAFFGIHRTMELADSSSLGFAFISMPLLFGKIPLGHIFGAIWFLLLFFAGITSSIAMGQIVVAFFEEIVGFTRKKAVLLTMGMILLLAQLAIFGKGSLDEMDTLAGTLGLVVMALVEVVIWVHVFGINKSWKSLMQGSKIDLWTGVKYIGAYITPVFIGIILIGWVVQNGASWFMMKGISEQEILYRWITRGVLFVVFLIICWISTRDMTMENKCQEAGGEE